MPARDASSEPSAGSPHGTPQGPPPQSDAGSSSPAGRRPAALLVLLGAVALEVLVLVVAAVLVVVEVLRGGSQSVGVSLFLVVFALGVAAVLVGSSRALLAGRRGGRAPITTWQLLQAVVGVTSWGVSPLAGAACVGVAAVVIALLMTRPVVEATTRA